jgi:hypothetical protein
MRWLAAITALLAAVSAAQAMGVRESGDWTAVCDNQRNCTALFVSTTRDPRGDGRAGYIMIGREGGPDATPHVSITVAAGGTLHLLFDGRRVPRLIPLVPAGIAFDTQEPIVTTGYLPYKNAQAAAFLEALRRAHTLTAKAGADAPVSFDLSGAADTLGWIDREQYRAHTTSALWDTAPRSAQPPPAPPLPRIAIGAPIDQSQLPQPPKALMDQVRATRCGGAAPTLFVTQRLSADTMLWAPACGMGVPSEDVYVGNDRGENFRPAALPPPPDLDPTVFHAAVSTMSSDGRYIEMLPSDRQCGRFIRWAWTGSAFVVSHEGYMLRCMRIPGYDQLDIFNTIVTPTH